MPASKAGQATREIALHYAIDTVRGTRSGINNNDIIRLADQYDQYITQGTVPEVATVPVEESDADLRD